MIPDVEALVSAYLRSQSDVAQLVGDRVGTRHPSATATPWVKLTLIADPTVSGSTVDHLIDAHLQIDCYGSSELATAQTEAKTLVRTVRAALARIHKSDHNGAVITGARFSGTGGGRVPDPDFEPARERYVLDAFIYCHDSPGGS